MIALGRVPVYIGSATAPTVKQFSSEKKVKQVSHKWADGSRGRSEGQPEYSFSMTCSLLQDKQLILTLIETAQANGEVNISFVVGTSEYMLVNCGVDTESITSDQDGTADLTISGIATDRLKVR